LFYELLEAVAREPSTWSRDPRGPTDGGLAPETPVSLTGWWADSDRLDLAEEPRTGGGAVLGLEGRCCCWCCADNLLGEIVLSSLPMEEVGLQKMKNCWKMRLG
jgi:hypothetical protein